MMITNSKKVGYSILFIDEEINNRYIAFENHPNKEYYDRVDRNYVQEEIWQIWGTHLEQHHEDYNFELVEIMHRFEKVIQKDIIID